MAACADAIVTLLAWIVGALVALYGLHRLALWAERHGWIYYRKRRGTSGALGSAALEIHAMLEPSKRYVLEERRRDDTEDEESGDPPEPGADRPAGEARGKREGP